MTTTLFSPQAAAVDREILSRPEPEIGSDEEPAASDAYFRALNLVRLNGSTVPLPALTLVQLDRHIRHYGPELVLETASAYPLGAMPLAAYRTNRPQGRRLNETDLQVIEHFAAEGSPASAIGSVLNLKEARVRKVLSDQAKARIGVPIPSIHAA